jgi:hypothetical protein
VAAGILGVAAMTAERNIAFFAVIAAPVLSRLRVLSHGRRVRMRPAGAMGYGLVILACVGAIAYVVARWQNGAPGWRPITAGAINAVRACPGPLFNHFEDGGYLMWAIPEKKVFVDSRIEAYPPDLLRRSQAADLSGDYRELFRDYGIACALVRTGSPLDANLRNDGMRVTYSDASRTVFATQSNERF